MSSICMQRGKRGKTTIEISAFEHISFSIEWVRAEGSMMYYSCSLLFKCSLVPLLWLRAHLCACDCAYVNWSVYVCMFFSVNFSIGLTFRRCHAALDCFAFNQFKLQTAITMSITMRKHCRAQTNRHITYILELNCRYETKWQRLVEDSTIKQQNSACDFAKMCKAQMTEEIRVCAKKNDAIILIRSTLYFSRFSSSFFLVASFYMYIQTAANM